MKIIKEAPPVEKRPKCPGCNKPLRPIIHTEEERYEPPGGGFAFRPVSRDWVGGYSGYGHFCTLRCCERYANLMFDRFGCRYEVVK